MRANAAKQEIEWEQYSNVFKMLLEMPTYGFAVLVLNSDDVIVAYLASAYEFSYRDAGMICNISAMQIDDKI